MAQKSRRYMGMTEMQIGILAGLGLFALLAICGMIWLILSTSMPASNPPDTAPVQATNPPTETNAPTLTPSEPTATNTPEGTLVPPGDWVEFKGSGAVIWLPDRFVGGDVVNHKADVIKKVRNVGPMFYSIADDLKKQKLPADMILLMLDSKGDVSLLVTSVSVRHKTMESDTTLQSYIETAHSLETPMPTINGTKKLTILGLETRRVVSQRREGTLEFTNIDYYIKDGNDLWLVHYSMAPTEYIKMLPFVDDSIKTFYIEK